MGFTSLPSYGRAGLRQPTRSSQWHVTWHEKVECRPGGGGQGSRVEPRRRRTGRGRPGARSASCSARLWHLVIAPSLQYTTASGPVYSELVQQGERNLRLARGDGGVQGRHRPGKVLRRGVSYAPWALFGVGTRGRICVCVPVLAEDSGIPAL